MAKSEPVRRDGLTTVGVLGGDGRTVALGVTRGGQRAVAATQIDIGISDCRGSAARHEILGKNGPLLALRRVSLRT